VPDVRRREDHPHARRPSALRRLPMTRPESECCHVCRELVENAPVIMVCCPDCGNKRCPKATDHDLECTGSNEPGQTGSIYG
jgi:hypothetical protein